MKRKLRENLPGADINLQLYNNLCHFRNQDQPHHKKAELGLLGEAGQQ